MSYADEALRTAHIDYTMRNKTKSITAESIRNARITCGECDHYSEPTRFNMYRACGEGYTRYCWGREWGIDKDFFCAHHSKLEKK